MCLKSQVSNFYVKVEYQVFFFCEDKLKVWPYQPQKHDKIGSRQKNTEFTL